MAVEFGKYQLLRRLAVGGMAEVFLGLTRGEGGFQKLVGIKCLLPQLTEDTESVSMFLDEARLMARFNHPNIVQVFDLGKIRQKYFLAMEFVHGRSLSRLVDLCAQKNRVIPFIYAVKIVSEVCDALDYAHNFQAPDGTPLRLVHRDISPQNIMVNLDGMVKILDFGIAKAVGNLSRTQPTDLKGKAAYMAPEQIARKKQVDRRADIFSLGVVLFQLITGKRPFVGKTELEIMLTILHQPVPDPCQVNPRIDPELCRIIRRAMHKDVNRRYQSAREMRLDLERYLARQEVVVDNQALARFVREIIPNNLPQVVRQAETEARLEPGPQKTLQLPKPEAGPEQEPVTPREKPVTPTPRAATPASGIRALAVVSSRPAPVDEPFASYTGGRTRPALVWLFLLVLLGGLGFFLVQTLVRFDYMASAGASRPRPIPPTAEPASEPPSEQAAVPSDAAPAPRTTVSRGRAQVHSRRQKAKATGRPGWRSVSARAAVAPRSRVIVRKDFDEPAPVSVLPARRADAPMPDEPGLEGDLALDAEIQIEPEDATRSVEIDSEPPGLAAVTPGARSGSEPVPRTAASDPLYQSAEELNKRRTAGQDPAYPRAARLARRGGSLLVRLTISPEGEVQAYRFLRRAPLFEQAVVDALRTWRFAPFLSDGKPVATFTVYRFLFKMD